MKRITIIFVNAILCLGMMVGSSLPVQAHNQNSQPNQQAGETNIYLPVVMSDYESLPPIIPDTTEVLPASTTEHLTSISGDGTQFTFDQSTPELAALAPDDIMVGDASPNAPDGFLRKVTSIENVGGQVVIGTADATLEEAIQQGEAHFSQVLTPDQVESAQYAPGVSLASPSKTALAGSFKLNIDKVLYDADGESTTTNDRVVAKGSIEVTPRLNFDFRLKNWHVQQMTFTLGLDDQVKIEVESKVEKSIKREIELVHYNLKPIVFWIWFIPVVVRPILTFVVGVEGSVYASVSVQVTQEAKLSGGVKYENDHWSPVSSVDNKFLFQPPTLSAGLELKGYAGPRLDLLVYGVAGPQIKLDGYVKLEANTAETPWWKLYGGLELSAGVRMKIFSHQIANINYIPYSVMKPLAQAPGSYFKVISISASGSHTCALSQAGGVKCWGDNLYGEVGDGTTTDRLTPVNVVGLASGVSAVSAGYEHTCVLKAGGVKCWGHNSDGQVGDGTTTDRLTPVPVAELASGVSAISAGAVHTCALKDGGVKCWGDNASGGLGDGTTTDRLTPVDVYGLSSGVSAISAGADHTCVLKDGGVKCWGLNGYGQLGDGTTTNHSTPVDVFGLTSGVSALSTGDGYTCALLTQTDGVKCWGFNGYGQLGHGTTIEEYHTPVNVVGLASGVSAISTGDRHACALVAGGVKCWGYNIAGQLGDGTTIIRLVPVNVVGLASGVSAISTGYWHTCALTQAGGVKCWGFNDGGELGNGTANSSLTPMSVIGIP
jgi:alpha-tubulin suppressor-like RCC1 family protein